MMDVNKILDRCDKVRKTGHNRWLACCPVHNENSPSFWITEKPDKIIVKCFGCGAGMAQVMDVLSLEWDDVFAESYKPAKSDPNYIRVPATDILAAIAFDVTVLGFYARNILDGVVHEESDLNRIRKACYRIIKAADYAK